VYQKRGGGGCGGRINGKEQNDIDSQTFLKTARAHELLVTEEFAPKQ
jgi:hypothetical protein